MATGRRNEAEISWRRARAIVDQLTLALSDNQLRDQFKERAITCIDRAAGRSRGDSRRRYPGGLTPREAEVAGLVSRGLANGEIADTLFVSKRTIETHISHVLSKLGYTSRAQIVSWVIDAGLDQATPNPAAGDARD
jgi:DNA-binding NarL/FixJ family response regulator